MSSGEKRKLKGWIKVLIVILVIIVVLIGGYFGLNKIFNDPYKVYTGLVNEVFDSTIKYTEEVYNSDLDYANLDKIKMEYNVNLQSSLEELKGFVDYKYGLNFAYDTKTKDMEAKININNKEDKRIFDIGAMLSKNKCLLESNSLYNKTIDLGKNEIEDYDDFIKMLDEILSKPKFDDIKKSFNDFRNSIINAIDKKDIKSKYDKLNIDGKDVTVIKYEYEFDKEVLNNVYNKIADDLLENYDFIEVLSKLFSMEPKEIEDKIRESKSTFTKADSFTITVYKKIFSSDIVKVTLLTADEEYIEYFQDVILYTYQKDEMKIDMSKDIMVVTFKEDGKQILRFDIKEFKPGVIDLKYDYSDEEDKLSGEIYFKINKKSDTSAFVDFSVSVLTKVEEKDINFRIYGNYSLYETKELNLVDKENVIEIDKLTEEDVVKIYKKALDIVKDTPFKSIVENNLT